jgi:hypothetical protein
MDEGMNESEHNHLSIGCKVIRKKKNEAIPRIPDL